MTNPAPLPLATQSNPTPNRNRGGGAPLGNRNGMRHGLRSSKLPPGCERIGRDLNAVRRALEDQFLSVHGRIDPMAALNISGAVEWEKHRRLASRWLRVNFEAMTPTERLNHSREAARAASERNRAVEALRLNARVDDWWDGTIHPSDVGTSLEGDKQ